MKELVLEKSGAVSSVGINASQLYGSNYFTFSPSTAGVRTIEIELSDKNDDADIRLVTVSDSNWSIMPHKLSSGKVTVTLDESNLPDKVIVVVCSFSDKNELPYTLTLK